jgi:hypothetical protein
MNGVSDFVASGVVGVSAVVMSEKSRNMRPLSRDRMDTSLSWQRLSHNSFLKEKDSD